jgi:hypothetical protein
MRLMLVRSFYEDPTSVRTFVVMLVNLDTLADGALIVVSPIIGDALNVVSLTLSFY